MAAPLASEDVLLMTTANWSGVAAQRREPLQRVVERVRELRPDASIIVLQNEPDGVPLLAAGAPDQQLPGSSDDLLPLARQLEEHPTAEWTVVPRPTESSCFRIYLRLQDSDRSVADSAAWLALDALRSTAGAGLAELLATRHHIARAERQCTQGYVIMREAAHAIATPMQHIMLHAGAIRAEREGDQGRKNAIGTAAREVRQQVLEAVASAEHYCTAPGTGQRLPFDAAELLRLVCAEPPGGARIEFCEATPPVPVAVDPVSLGAAITLLHERLVAAGVIIRMSAAVEADGAARITCDAVPHEGTDATRLEDLRQEWQRVAAGHLPLSPDTCDLYAADCVCRRTGITPAWSRPANGLSVSLRFDESAPRR